MNSCLGRQQAAPGLRAARALAPGCRIGQQLSARSVPRSWALAGSSPHCNGAISLESEASAVPEPEIRADGSVALAAAATEAAAAVSGSAAVAANSGVAAAVDDAAGASGQQAQELQQQAQPVKKGSNFINRVIFGIILGFGGAAVVFAGQIPYCEFYGMLTSKGISKGTPPPTPFVSAATTALCLSVTAFTFVSQGRSGAAMSVAAFILLAMNILVNRKPTFAQLTASVFGLFYCGYLPSFWIKLRNLNIAGPQLQLPGLSSEALATITSYLPTLTVGLVATLTSVACIIAADTGAYFVGKTLGRTKLTEISPKKTVEGAIGGLASAVLVAALFWQVFGWPGSMAAAAGYGVLTFVSSLFGDLIESIMKRDAGLKDSGNLIPGHGGLLDRMDSYMFSGAVAYFYITLVLPRFGLL
ncbi:cytidylyltransferase family-domain-containing protein [Scenedesmus sp. NREL 46B-D3]|nr:cytidylyltransferase family-domain-containing protein [Scenedesmus sp. NREL 46B-D3]